MWYIIYHVLGPLHKWVRTLGKGYGIEQGAVGNILEEHHERTHWEPGEHHWEHDGWEHMN
jgi:hypothetical protein